MLSTAPKFRRIFVLSGDDDRAVSTLAAAWGCNRSAAVRRLIREAAAVPAVKRAKGEPRKAGGK